MSYSDTVFAQRVRVMQITLVALMMGATIFLAIAIYMRATGFGKGLPDNPVLGYAGLVMAAICLVGQAVIPKTIADRLSRNSASASPDGVGATPASSTISWLQIYQAQLIFGAALLEGPLFVFVITYLINGTAWALALAFLFLLGLAAKFPTVSRVERWVESRLELWQQREMGL